MKTVAEKKRILNMPTVVGELRVNGNWISGKEILKFDSIEQSSNTGEPNTSCIERQKRPQDGYVYIKCNTNYVELWAIQAGFKLSMKLKYSDIEILWCKYQGVQRVAA